MAATYYRSATLDVNLYLKIGDNYIYLGGCSGQTNDNNRYDDNMSMSLSAAYTSSSNLNLPLITSYSTWADLYIKITGYVNYHADDISYGINGSTASGGVTVNYDMLKYILDYTYFKYCSSNATLDLRLNTTSGSNYYSGTSVKNNSNSGNYGTIASMYNSGSGQIYVPQNITYSFSGYATYDEGYGYNGEQRFYASFDSGYVQIGRFNVNHSESPAYVWSTTKNYKNCPTIQVNDRFYFNKIPVSSFSLWAYGDGDNYIGMSVSCTAGSSINNSNYTTAVLPFKGRRPEIKLNSDLNLKFYCNPALTSTNLYYIGTEKLTNTDLLSDTEWAEISDPSNTYPFDGISYFYLDIKNYEDLLDYAGDSYNTGKLEFTVSTDSNSNYAPYSMTLYMIDFSRGHDVDIYTIPTTLLDSHIKKRIPYLEYYINNTPTYNSVDGYDGFSPSNMFYIAGEEYDEPYIAEGYFTVSRGCNKFICSSTNYDNTSRSIKASLNISDIIEDTADYKREHPSIISFLCEIVYLPDNPASGSNHDILIHSSQTYNKFKDYHIINIAMPRTLVEDASVDFPATTLESYTTLLQANYPSFDDHDINHNVTTILDTYDDPDDDTRNTVLSKKVFTDLLFYDNPATAAAAGTDDGNGKIVTVYNINTGTNINKSMFFDLTEDAANAYFTNKDTYQNTLISDLFGVGSADDYAKVINWPIDDPFICWCTDPFASTTKTNWRYFNFTVPITKNTNFSLITCSYIDDSDSTSEDYQTTENTYRNLSFTIPDQSNYTNIVV